MSVLGFIGIILGFFAIPVAFTHTTRLKVAFLTLLYLVHILVSIIYYWRAQIIMADSAIYYYDFVRAYQDGFAFGTQAIVYITQFLKTNIGGTYLDYYMIYQATGFLGIAVLLRIFEEIHQELQIPDRFYLYALVAIPSLHFWSSALGKDAPFLLAISLTLWASMRLPSRAKALIGALAIMLVIRPHIAIVAVVALSLSVAIGRGIPVYMRVALFLVGTVGAAVAISALQSTYGIDVTNSESITGQFERRDMILETEDAGSTAVRGAFPIRLLSLLFRPFFFDANEPFALIASIENVFLVYLFLVLLWRRREVISLFRNVFFVRYGTILALGLTLFFALSYWNVGLGLRQKWSMMMPLYLTLFVAVLAVRQANKRSLAGRVQVVPPAYRPPGQPRPAAR